jgi:hypothetical protein
MYPALILIIVNKERSIVNSFGFSTALGGNLNGEGHDNRLGTENHPATIGHLVFANPPSKSTHAVDNDRPLSSRHSSNGPGM